MTGGDPAITLMSLFPVKSREQAREGHDTRLTQFTGGKFLDY